VVKNSYFSICENPVHLWLKSPTLFWRKANFPITYQISQNQTQLISHFFYKYVTPSGLFTNLTTPSRQQLQPLQQLHPSAVAEPFQLTNLITSSRQQLEQIQQLQPYKVKFP